MLIRKQFPGIVAEGGDFLILLGFELDGLGDDQKKLGEMGARASRFVDAPEKYELGTAPVRTPRRCVPPYDARRVPKTISGLTPIHHGNIASSYRISDKHRLGLQPRALQEL